MEVLFIDDDYDDYLIFCEALKQLNSETRCEYKGDGRAALTFLREQSALPDYIFLDINMPVMDGVECLKRIKMDKRLKDIPVILFTTSLSPWGEKINFKELGADQLIIKPSRFEEIVNFLRALGG